MSEQKKVGRPRKDDILKQPFAVRLIKEMLANGADDVEVASVLGVHRSTIHRWKEKNQEFCDTLNKAKGQAIAKVEQSLFKQAMGYNVHTPHYDSEGKLTGFSTEYVKPNVVAAIFFLKNKDPKGWRQNPDGAGGEDFDLAIEFVRGEKKKADKDIIEVPSENVTHEHNTAIDQEEN